MSGGAPRVPDYLGHMLQAIRRIGRYADGMDEAAFLKNELVQDAVIRNIEVIGEAARNIERDHSDFSSQHPDVPWGDIYLMRNRGLPRLLFGGLGNRLENREARRSGTGTPARSPSVPTRGPQ